MIFLISILGVYSGSKLPMEFLPSIDNPAITVTTLSQGLDAETMTKDVTHPSKTISQFRTRRHHYFFYIRGIITYRHYVYIKSKHERCKDAKSKSRQYN